MRLFLVILFVFLFQLKSNAQLKPVDFYIQELSEKIKADSSRKIYKSFLITNEIKNIDTFYSGVKAALNEKKLNLMIVTKMTYLSNCFIEALDKSEVSHSFLEKSIYDSLIYDLNNGYNLIMIQRIVDSLGVDFMLNYGKEDTSKYELFDYIDEITGSISLNVINDSTVVLKLNKSSIAKSHYENLDGVVFSDARTGKRFLGDDFYKGVDFKIANSRAYLYLSFKKYENPKFCLPEVDWQKSFQIPINIE